MASVNFAKVATRYVVPALTADKTWADKTWAGITGAIGMQVELIR